MSNYQFSKPIIYCHRDRFVARARVEQTQLDGRLHRNQSLVVTGETMEITYSELCRMIGAKWGQDCLRQFLSQQWLRMLSSGVRRINRQSQQLIGN